MSKHLTDAPPQLQHPRVIAYARRDTDLEIVQRTDIIEDYDLQILDIKRKGAKQRTVRIINIYNAPDTWHSVDRLRALNLDPRIPTVITGDWNLKHILYRDMPNGQNANQRAELTAEWLTTSGFELRNDWNEETWCNSNTSQTSALDFTFFNQSCDTNNILQNWSIEKEASCGSDHYATYFTLGGGEDELVELTEAKYNWKKMDKKKLTDELSRQLNLDEEEHERIFTPLRYNPLVLPTTPEQIDEALEFYEKCQEESVEKSVPRSKPSKFAQPWWTDECTEAIKAKIKARDESTSARALLGQPDPVLVRNVQHLAAVAKRVCEKAKQDYHVKRVMNTDNSNLWELLKWTRGNRQYPSPPLSRGEGVEPALTHTEKCEVLRQVLLPPPPILANPPQYNLDPDPNDLTWHPVSKDEVRRAIFAAAADNAPGISQMTGAVYKTAWTIAHEEIYLIVSAAARIGYHPLRFRNSICIAIRKPKKKDYSAPNAYRPIQLLEVLGKALERIQADRMSYLALKHDMIPPLHFGGVKGKSAEDAILCAVHDLKAAQGHGLVSTTLTFDISGFFNNISHDVLLHKLRQFRMPLPIVAWVKSFLSDRQTAMCLDGRREDSKPTMTGTPQGSPASGILAALVTASLTETLHEAFEPNRLQETDPDLLALISLERRHALSQILYVDDGRVTISTSKISTNVRAVAKAYQVVDCWMTDIGMAIDRVKRELQHNSNRTQDYKSSDGGIPPIETPVTIFNEREGVVTIKPSKTIKWLGVIFDNKLNFIEHLKTVSAKAINSVNALGMLGSSLRGLHQVYRRYLIQGAILPMVLYASPAWWNGTKAQANYIDKVQNAGLRYILGAFRTTPIYAMQIEASMPPARVLLDYLIDKKAIQCKHLSPRHPIAHRLPPAHRSNSIRGPDRIPFPEPHPPIGERVQAVRRAKLSTKYEKCTPIYRIGHRILTNMETIDRFALPPWHRVDSRVTISVPPNDAGKSMKKDWAKRHKKKIRELRKDDRIITIYTDGSLRHVRGVRFTGAGLVAYRGDTAIFSHKMALGSMAEVYDAEMEGLAKAAELFREWVDSQELDASFSTVYFFADNTGALQRIYKGTPGYDQNCSLRFRDAVHHVLDSRRASSIEIEWVPGHHGIQGNDTADKLAKKGSADAPANANFMTAAFAGNSRKRVYEQRWKEHWQSDSTVRDRSQYAPVDTSPPSLRLSNHFEELSRKTFSRLIQCLTGHAHIGSYYDYMSIDEPTSCPCGEILQTRIHLILECPRFNNQRRLLRDKKTKRIDYETLLGTPRGIRRLAKFLEATNAYDKPLEREPP